MTPLIDVMLVLLIIFIITLPRLTNAVKFDNPRSQNMTAPVEVVDLSIDFDGAILWNQVQIDRAGLRHRISLEAAKSPPPEVHIRVDRFAKYEVVAQTLAELQSHGLSKIGFINNELF